MPVANFKMQGRFGEPPRNVLLRPKCLESPTAILRVVIQKVRKKCATTIKFLSLCPCFQSPDQNEIPPGWPPGGYLYKYGLFILLATTIIRLKGLGRQMPGGICQRWASEKKPACRRRLFPRAHPLSGDGKSNLAIPSALPSATQHGAADSQIGFFYAPEKGTARRQAC